VASRAPSEPDGPGPPLANCPTIKNLLDFAAWVAWQNGLKAAVSHQTLCGEMPSLAQAAQSLSVQPLLGCLSDLRSLGAMALFDVACSDVGFCLAWESYMHASAHASLWVGMCIYAVVCISNMALDTGCNYLPQSRVWFGPLLSHLVCKWLVWHVHPGKEIYFPCLNEPCT
jgi:hypothetical protein